MCQGLTGTSAVLPQDLRMALKIDVQDFSSVPNAGSNEQAFSVGGQIKDCKLFQPFT